MNSNPQDGIASALLPEPSPQALHSVKALTTAPSPCNCHADPTLASFSRKISLDTKVSDLLSACIDILVPCSLQCPICPLTPASGLLHHPCLCPGTLLLEIATWLSFPFRQHHASRSPALPNFLTRIRLFPQSQGSLYISLPQKDTVSIISPHPFHKKAFSPTRKEPPMAEFSSPHPLF